MDQNISGKIKVGIIGGAGYTAGEMIRILLNHPKATIEFVKSISNAGNPVSWVHGDLVGETELVFTDSHHFDVDVLFLCMGHGNSKTFLSENEVPEAITIIDLSRDFRIKSADNPFVYGLPELNKAAIRQSDRIANPGCFATAIQLALLPLAQEGYLQDDVHINAITGSTGAGQKPTSTSHFSWRNNNVSIYKAFNHQHLEEIQQSLLQLQPAFKRSLHFIPMRGNFTRGIFATAYIETNITLDLAMSLYAEFYSEDPFVILSEHNPHLKQVVNTNKCILYLAKFDNQLLIVSMIDNLVKGASGQAVQNMNLVFGLPEQTGLALKGIAF